MYRLLYAWLSLLGFPFANSLGLAAVYEFTNVADTQTIGAVGTLTGFGLGCDGPACIFTDPPAISGSTAAFFATYAGGNGIFTGDGKSFTTIALSGEVAPLGTFIGFMSPSIHDGSVAFRASYGNQFDLGNGIFAGSGGALTTIAKRGDPAPNGIFSGFRDPSISDGKVAFSGLTNRDGVFIGDGGPLSKIAQLGDSSPSGVWSGIGSPAISGDNVTFIGVGGGINGIYTISDGEIMTIAETGDLAPMAAL